MKGSGKEFEIHIFVKDGIDLICLYCCDSVNCIFVFILVFIISLLFKCFAFNGSHV